MSKIRPEERRISNIWMISREYDGLAGAGGVKDVCRQLAETMVAKGGVAVTVVIPRYGFLDPPSQGFEPLGFPPSRLRAGQEVTVRADMNYTNEERWEEIRYWQDIRRGVRLLLVESPRFAEKLGVYTYTAAEAEKSPWQHQGSGHFDYFAMNILLQKAALELMILLREEPDVIHCHDGHAATLVPMARELAGYRSYFGDCGMVVTIHNAGLGYHQEVDDLPFARSITGLPASVIERGRLGPSFDPFVAASSYSIINTVSEQYARELQETDEDARTGWLGHELLSRGVTIAGVTNGINPRDFDPEHPERLGLKAGFSPVRGELEGKRLCKLDLLEQLALGLESETVMQSGSLETDADLPLLTFIGRITAQKGVDVLLRAMRILARQEQGKDFQLLVLGSGDPELERFLVALCNDGRFKGRSCFLSGYDPPLATRIYAAGDFFLLPSLYEPCGLTDYIAQLLGNLPIVHRVGGLVKVLDGQTGFCYDAHSGKELSAAIQRGLRCYYQEPEMLRRMQRRAVEHILTHHTWEKVMEKYLELYRQAVEMAVEVGPYPESVSVRAYARYAKGTNGL